MDALNEGVAGLGVAGAARLRDAVALCRRTAHYPAEARFKWNTEIMWAVDSYLKQASEDKRNEFIEAVRQGRIHGE